MGPGRHASTPPADRADPERLRHGGQPAAAARRSWSARPSYAPADFDARFSARARRYRYTVVNRPVPDPFLAATTWWVPEPLDLAALRLGCDPLHRRARLLAASAAGRRASRAAPTMVRRVLDARWHDLGDGLLRFDIAATAFCHQMVRSIVGTLVDMGRGRRRAGEMAGDPAGPRPSAGRPGGAAPRPVPLGGRCTDRATSRRPPVFGMDTTCC